MIVAKCADETMEEPFVITNNDYGPEMESFILFPLSNFITLNLPEQNRFGPFSGPSDGSKCTRVGKSLTVLIPPGMRKRMVINTERMVLGLNEKVIPWNVCIWKSPIKHENSFVCLILYIKRPGRCALGAHGSPLNVSSTGLEYSYEMATDEISATKRDSVCFQFSE